MSLVVGPEAASAQTTLRWTLPAASPPATVFRVFKGAAPPPAAGELVYEDLPEPAAGIYSADVQIDEIDQGVPVCVWLTALNEHGESPESNANCYPEGCDPGLDSDCDGIPNDGAPGDVPCGAGQTVGCDDNCPYWSNPGQQDSGGVEVGGIPVPPDGIGNACQCGDVTGDGRVNLLDYLQFERHIRAATPFARPENCDLLVTPSAPGCNLLDYIVLTRAIQTVPTQTIQQTCESALAP